MVLAGCAALVAFHVVFLLHAGAPWRDEVNSVEMASMPSWAAIRASLGHDSFPILYTALLRAWLAGPWGVGDTGLRALGLLVGLVVLGALGFAARALGSRTPWLALALFGFNVVAIRATDSIRPYGLGAAAVVLTFALVWRLVERPGPARFAWAAVAASAAVQLLYPNALLVLGIVLAGTLVALRRGPRGAAAVAGAGTIAALSLAPYSGALGVARGWAPLVQFPFGFPAMWAQIRTALGSGSALLVPVTLILAAALCAWAIVTVARRAPARPGDGGPGIEDRVLYSAVAVAATTAALLVFLRATRFPTQPWYYVPLMALAAAALNGGFADVSPARAPKHGNAALAWIPPLAVAIAALLTWSALVPGLRARQTNVDLVARRVTADAARGDLVIVNPWFVGVGFRRYYHGAAAWMTLPTLAELRIHRYDLLKQRLQQQEPIRDVLDSLETTLRAGRRVWLVGGLQSPPAGQPARVLPALQGSALARLDGTTYLAFLSSWSAQAGAMVLRHATQAAPVEIAAPGPVSTYENLPLYVVSGWSDTPR